MFLIPTTQAVHLAKSIAGKNKIEVVYPDFNKDHKRNFPDGEVYIKIPNIKKLKNKRVTILHSGAPNPNDGIAELELVLKSLKENGVGSLRVFFSYFPYCMQDRAFSMGEPNAAENLIDKLVNYYTVTDIYIIDPHFSGRSWVRKYPVTPVSAVPLLKEAAFQDFGKGIVFASPDGGSRRRTGISGTKKKRHNSYNVTVEQSEKILNKIKGKTVAVVDDLLKTGGTLVAFNDYCCKSAGIKNCLALITHGLLQEGVDRIQKNYTKLYFTNTINRESANVDITDLIATTLLKNEPRLSSLEIEKQLDRVFLKK